MPKSSPRKKSKPSHGKRLRPAGPNQTIHSDEIRLEQVNKIPVASKVDVAREREKKRLVTLAFCDYVSVDNIGKVNLMGCFDRIYPNPETKATGNFYLYVRTAETKKGHIEITFFDPSNKPIMQAGYDLDASNAPADLPIHAQFNGQVGFVAKTFGVYWVDVAFNGESLGGRDLTVSEREGEEGII